MILIDFNRFHKVQQKVSFGLIWYPLYLDIFLKNTFFELNHDLGLKTGAMV